MYRQAPISSADKCGSEQEGTCWEEEAFQWKGRCAKYNALGIKCKLNPTMNQYCIKERNKKHFSLEPCNKNKSRLEFSTSSSAV